MSIGDPEESGMITWTVILYNLPSHYSVEPMKPLGWLYVLKLYYNPVYLTWPQLDIWNDLHGNPLLKTQTVRMNGIIMRMTILWVDCRWYCREKAQYNRQEPKKKIFVIFLFSFRFTDFKHWSFDFQIPLNAMLLLELRHCNELVCFACQYSTYVHESEFLILKLISVFFIERAKIKRLMTIFS